MRTIFAFNRPRLAITAVALTVFALIVAIHPHTDVEKFGYMIAMGFGVGFLVTGAKAMVAEFANLSVLLVILGVAMILAAIFGTPATVFAASALEEEAVVIIGAGLGLFSKLEES